MHFPASVLKSDSDQRDIKVTETMKYLVTEVCGLLLEEKMQIWFQRIKI